MAAIAACVNGVIALVCLVFSYETSANLYLISTLVTLAVISLGSLEILARLSLGHAELATLLAGRPVPRTSSRDDERRLINIVEDRKSVV